MILLLRVIDERCGIELSAGTIVFPIEDRLDHIAFMTPDGKIVRIRGVSRAEIMIDRTNIESNPSRNISDPTRELRIFRDGSMWWFKNGQPHRDAQPGQSPGPAFEYANGTKWWCKNGQLHRDAQPGQSPGPAIVWADGSKEWYKNGNLVRKKSK